MKTLTEIEYQAVLANDELEVLQHTEKIVQEAQLDENGMMVSPEIISHDLKAKRTKTGGQVRVVSVPPEEFLISRRAVDIESAQFICHRVKKSVSDLILEGYDPKVVENMPSYSQSQAEYNEERLARFSYDDDAIPPDEGSGAKQKNMVR